jgi:hypothetical protein
LPFALTNVCEVIHQRNSFVKLQESLDQGENCGLTVEFFNKILPNLDILDIGAIAVTYISLRTKALFIVPSTLHDLYVSVFRCTPGEATYRGCHFLLLRPLPYRVNDNMNSLHETHLDPFGVCLHHHSPPIAAYCQEYSQLEQEEWFAAYHRLHDVGPDWVLLQEHPNLERVTIKHADDAELSNDSLNDLNWTALSKEALIKFVRHTPKLR